MEFWQLVTTGVGQRNFFSSLSRICSDLQGFIFSVIFPFFQSIIQLLFSLNSGFYRCVLCTLRGSSNNKFQMLIGNQARPYL